jgi:hypothetical protein
LGLLEVVEQALVGRWENPVACQHHSSLDVHSHRHYGFRDITQILGLLDFLEGTGTRRDSAFVLLGRLVRNEDGADGGEFEPTFTEGASEVLLVGS